MTKRLAAFALGLAAAASIAFPTSASANHPCWTGGVQNCFGENVREILENIEHGE